METNEREEKLAMLRERREEIMVLEEIQELERNQDKETVEEN